MKIRVFGLALVSAVCLFASPSAFGWGCKGHQTIALIAKKYLTPEATKLANEMLAIDPGRPIPSFAVCSTAGVDSYAAGATWADAVRQKGLDDGWHYVDVPRGGDQSMISTVCAKSPSCVVNAIHAQMAVLEDSSADPKLRAAALRYILHFAGDIHQPLHCTTNGDRGANCVPITFFKNKPSPSKTNPDDYSPNLHGIWDTQMVEKDMTAMSAANVQAYADALDTAYKTQIAVWQLEPISPEDWAWDSHQHAEDIAYGDLPKLIPIDPHPDADLITCSDNNRVGNRMFHKHLKLGQPYQDDASDVIRERLAMAGIRLALLLNEAAKNVH
jgi:hypothetical protein